MATPDIAVVKTMDGLNFVTTEEAIRLTLPPGSLVMAGHVGLKREVTWVTRLRPTPPAFGHLEGGELVLLAEKALQLLDDRLTLEEAVRHLSSFNVAGIAHLGSISDAAIQAARLARVSSESATRCA